MTDLQVSELVNWNKGLTDTHESWNGRRQYLETDQQRLRFNLKLKSLLHIFQIYSVTGKRNSRKKGVSYREVSKVTKVA